MRILSVFFMVILSGCAANCPAPPAPVVQVQTVDTACDWDDAALVHDGDVLSDATAKWMLKHNLAGSTRCGWKPTAGK